MPVDRELFTASFNKEGAPNWPCMTCRGGHLRLYPDSLKHLDTATSIEASRHEAHEPDWDRARAIALVICDNPKCKEPATIAAEGTWVEDPDWERQEMNYMAVFSPTHFNPSPPLIEVPDACPEAAKAEIKLAFVSSWGDQAAAANHIRTAVERLLDARRIPTINTRKGPTKAKRKTSLRDALFD